MTRAFFVIFLKEKSNLQLSCNYLTTELIINSKIILRSRLINRLKWPLPVAVYFLCVRMYSNILFVLRLAVAGSRI